MPDPMKTILLVSELGGGLGHIAPLLSVARRIQAKTGSRSKTRMVLACQDAISCRKTFKDIPFAVVNAPVLEPNVELTSHSSSYAEILAKFGYSRKSVLSAAVSSWDDLFTITKADLIIADHSPTACLAARGKIPVVQIGTGFTIPPLGLPNFPALRSGSAPPIIQGAILNTVNELLQSRKQAQLGTLPEILDTEARAIFTLPQLDPYGPIRNEQVLGSYHEGLKPLGAPKAPEIFLYLSEAVQNLEPVLQLATQNGLGLSAYLGSDKSSVSQLLKIRGATVYENPPDLSDILKRASIVVSHGGTGLATAALICGRPQILLPRYVESEITAQRIQAMGAGIVVEEDWDKKLVQEIKSMIAEPSYADCAHKIATKIEKLELPDKPVDITADAALNLLA